MNKKLDQRGAVAIISVVIFSMIVTVLITAYLRSAVVHQQESVNYDFSNRAFYAAESGVQDTIRVIRADNTMLADKSDCDPSIGSDADFGAADFGLSYNCQLVTIAPAEITGSVEPNKKSAMIKLEPSVPVGSDTSLVVRWSLKVQPGSTSTVLYPRDDGSKLFSPITKWLLNNDQDKLLHPALKVAVIDHPSTSPFQREDINQRVVFLNPTNQDNDEGAVNFNKADNSIAVQQEEMLNNAQCYESDEVVDDSVNMKSYSCKQTIDIDDYFSGGSTVYVRVGSIYRSTSFSIELLNGGAPVTLNNSQVVIDVTGKSGDSTYRRVKQAVPLSNYQVQYGPDAAIVAGEGICKQFGLGTDPSTFATNAGCNPLSSND
jgi:hypothetical protein